MKNFSLAIIIFAAVHVLSGQENHPADTAENIIMKAMRDELKRSMRELEYEEYKKPFFISYAIADAHTMVINATLGSLIKSDISHIRDWYIRVMIGDYKMTDENFEDIGTGSPDYTQYLKLPLDDDYYGIRRCLWEATDKVYKSASQTYKNKINALADKDIDPENLPLADFSYAPVVSVNIAGQEFDFNKSKYEDIARDLSSLFDNYPEIIYSEVTLAIFYADIYFINSEGTEVKMPLELSSIAVNAQAFADDGEILSNQLLYYFRNPDEYPDPDVLNEDVTGMVDNLIALKQAETYNDNYSGPVLITDQAVAQLMAFNLFSGTNSLIAYREPLYANPQMSVYYGQRSFSTESKIDKRIISKYLSVSARHGLENYNGIDLIGNFSVDGEGVIPPDSLVLIENGILKTLLNDRTPTKKIDKSNGHNRFAIMGAGFTKQLGPGVIFISGSEGKSRDDMKNELIERAKEEGLDYAIMIKPIASETNYRPVNVYKVSIKDGSEKLIRSVNLNNLIDNSLKDVLCVSAGNIVYNAMFPEAMSGGMFESFMSGTDIINGLPSSFIVPDAILIEEIEIEGISQPLSGNLPIVDNPVGKHIKFFLF
jgi:hypothetical protein